MKNIFKRRPAEVRIKGAVIFLTEPITLEGRVCLFPESDLISITKEQKKEVDKLFNKFAKQLKK